jgi:mono/diheme cytochrome c family protein
MRFFFGFVTAIVVTIIALLTVVWAGLFNVAVTQNYTTLERFLNFATARSIAWHADTRRNPYAEEPQVLEAGLQAYVDMCLMCHGAPGIEPSEFARHLSPQPPEMTSAVIQALTDGELFWIIANGIMATGMPAFGPSHREEGLWQIVTFVRHLPELSAAERQRLLAAHGGSHPAGHEHGQAGYAH